MQHAPQYKKAKIDKAFEPEMPVFVVDDDPAYLNMLGFYLKKNTNCKVYCYFSGEECLQNINLNPRVIVLDYYLNENMNGIEVLKQIKKINPETEVVMLSGQETLQVATDSLKSGAFSYVIKDRQAFYSIRKIIEDLYNGTASYDLGRLF